MLTCQELTELVTDRLEGRLSLADRLRFHLHLGLCRHCRAYLRQMKRTIGLTAEVPPEPMPEDVQRELLARFRTWKAPDQAE